MEDSQPSATGGESSQPKKASQPSATVSQSSQPTKASQPSASQSSQPIKASQPTKSASLPRQVYPSNSFDQLSNEMCSQLSMKPCRLTQWDIFIAI